MTISSTSYPGLARVAAVPTLLMRLSSQSCQGSIVPIWTSPAEAHGPLC